MFRENDDAPEVALYTLEATYAVDYIVISAPEREDLNRFIEFNCPHNAWPFWRQHVYDTLKRASLPVPAIPLFSSKPTGKKRKKINRVRRAIDSEKFIESSDQ